MSLVDLGGRWRFVRSAVLSVALAAVGIVSNPGAALADPPRTLSEGMNAPVGVAVVGGEVYVANVNSGYVTVYDADSGALLRSLSHGTNNLAGVAVASGEVYVANWSGDNVEVFDASTGDPLRTISGSMHAPAGVAVAGGELYVGNDFGNNVTVYDAVGGQLLRTIAGDMSTPYGVTVADGQLYVSNFDTDEVTVYDQVTGALLRTISGGMNNPVGVALAGGQMYVANSNNHNVTVYDVETGALQRTITGRMNLPYGLTLAGEQLYVANWFGDNVTIYGRPSPPTDVSGIPGDGRVAVTWDAPRDDGGTPILDYEVTAFPGGATCRSSGDTSCTVEGLINGVGYEFTATATNAMGRSNRSSPSVRITPRQPPPPKAKTELTVQARGAHKPLLPWRKTRLVRAAKVSVTAGDPRQIATPTRAGRKNLRVAAHCSLWGSRLTPAQSRSVCLIKKVNRGNKVKVTVVPTCSAGLRVNVKIRAKAPGATATTWTRAWNVKNAPRIVCHLAGKGSLATSATSAV